MEFKKIDHLGHKLLVSLDYYMKDGVRWPVDAKEAEQIAESFGCFLPDPGMVDSIWEQADIKLPPKPLPPTSEMTKESYFRKHNAIINDLLSHMDTQGKLIAGHKKDIVKSNRARRVAIYGWHQSDGRPIQPYSTVHGEYYADYSHGLRLVKYA